MQDNKDTLPLSDRSGDFRVLRVSQVKNLDAHASAIVQGKPRANIRALGHERPRKRSFDEQQVSGRDPKRQKHRNHTSQDSAEEQSREEGEEKKGSHTRSDPYASAASHSGVHRVSSTLLLPVPSSSSLSLVTLPPSSAYSSQLSGYDTETAYIPPTASGSRG